MLQTNKSIILCAFIDLMLEKDLLMNSHEKVTLCESEVLKRRALHGDPELVGDLIACFQDDLLGFLRKRCGNREDAQDATQDTFESALRYLEGYRGESSLKNWLYRLASSACTRMRRGQKNAQKLHISIDAQASPFDAALGQGMEEMLEARLMPVQEALRKLKPLDRSVLLLRDGEGLSTTETAQELELSESAVKSRLHRARKELRKALGE